MNKTTTTGNGKSKLFLSLLAALVLAGSVTSVVTIASAASTDSSTITATVASGTQQHTPPAAMGKVTAISGTTITITSNDQDADDVGTTASTYTVDASNATVTKGQGTASSISAIAVGDMIAVDGTISGTTVTATAIHDGFGDRGGHGGPSGFGGGTRGTVSAINGSTLTVTDKAGGTYTVDAASASVMASGTASTVSSIKVGDAVVIRGKVTTASMTATDIEDGIPTPPVGSKATTSSTVTQ